MAPTSAPPESQPQPESPPQPQSKAEQRAEAKRRDRHLYQLDLVRLVTFAAVILDHVLISTVATTSIVSGGVQVLLRYSRYSFFALTGFVLTYTYRNRPLDARKFWSRRYKLIGLPYLAWSLFYWLYGYYSQGGVQALRTLFDTPSHALLSLKSIGYDLLTGNAWNHLYFLFVSMQIYLIFPLLLIVLKKTFGYHRYLLVVSFAAQTALFYFMVRSPAHFLTFGPQGVVWAHLVCTLLPYQFFVLAGCLAAMHFEAFQSFMKRWWPVIVAAGVVVLGVTVGYYVHEMHVGHDMFRATNVFMVHNSFAYITIIAMLYTLGMAWQHRRTPGSGPDVLLKTAADRSFGIYLAHALVLDELLPTVTKHPNAPAAVVAIGTFITTVAVTVLIVETLRRSPISLITTGRETIDFREQRPALSMSVGLAAVVVGLVFRLVEGASVGNVITVTGVLLVLSAALVAWRQRNAVQVDEDAVCDSR